MWIAAKRLDGIEFSKLLIPNLICTFTYIYLKLKQSKAVGCQHSFAALRACQAKGAASGEEVGSGTRSCLDWNSLEGHVTYMRVVQPCRDKEMPSGAPVSLPVGECL